MSTGSRAQLCCGARALAYAMAAESSASEEEFAAVTESASEVLTVSSSRKCIRFTTRQKAILAAHYNCGMMGVGELYSTRIASAAREARLEVDQVKVGEIDPARVCRYHICYAELD